MADNRGVAYMGPGKVEVQNIDFPKLELKDGPGRQPGKRGAQDPARGDPEDRRDEHLRLATSTWCAAARPRPTGLILGHEITGEVIETGPRRRVHQGGRSLLGAVQHRLRPLPQLQGGQHRRLPERQPRPPRLGVRLRRHGRLGRRPGRVRDGALRRLEPAEVPRQGAGDGEDPRPDDALGHLPDRLPRLRHAPASRPGSTVYIAGAGPVGLAAAHSAQLLGAAVVIVGDLIPERLEQARSFGCETVDVSKGEPEGPDRADPRRARGRLRRRRRRLRGARPRRGRRRTRRRRPC